MVFLFIKVGRQVESAKNSDKATKRSIQMEESWKAHLHSEFEKPYMLNLRKFLVDEMRRKKLIFPKPEEYFQALNKTHYDKVKVVILGQDPYHGPGQAHGLCFSVRPGVPLPPSLKNIFGELKRDLNMDYPNHGFLEPWALQGVLLLNSVLTVSAGRAGSHQNQGWEEFTDRILSVLNQNKQNLVFMLWGSYALRKGQFLNHEKHLVLKAPHPSPLSASRGFFGCSHFSKTNEYLKSKGKKPIDWRLSPVPP